MAYDATNPPATSRARSPLPWRAVTVLFLIMTAELTAIFVVLPFAPFMVRSFQIARSDAEVGYWVGWILAAFPLAQVISSYPWGALSDRVGRTKVIVWGLFGTSVFLVLFGVSDTLWKASLARFCAGLFNGNLGVVKSLLGDITDASNQAQAFALFGLATSVGVVIGPVVGGTLSNVADRSRFLASWSFFKEYPFFLPSAVVGGAVAICALVTPLALGDVERTLRSKKREAAAENAPLLEVQDPLNDVPSAKSPYTVANKANSRPSAFPYPAKLAVSAYGLCAFQYVIVDDLFPLFCMQPRGTGLAFTATQVGLAFAIKGVALFLYGPFLLPAVQRRLGTSRTLTLASLLSLSFALTPALGRVPAAWRWTGAGAYMAACAVLSNTQLTSSMLAIAETAPEEHLGAVNGVGQSAAALARAVGPVVGSVLFAWGVESGYGFPLDAHLAYLLASLSGGAAALCGVVLGRGQ